MLGVGSRLLFDELLWREHARHSIPRTEQSVGHRRAQSRAMPPRPSPSLPLSLPCFRLQHPISLRVQLPNDASRPEWKLDGSVVTVPELPLTLLVSTLRDRLIQHTGSTIGASKIRFSYAGKMLTNTQTIAVYNLEDEDLIVATLRDEKKKK